MRKNNIWEQLSEQVTQTSWILSVKKLIILLETVDAGSQVLNTLIMQTFGNMEAVATDTRALYDTEIPIISGGQVVRFFEENGKVKIQLVASDYFLEATANTTGLAMAILSIKVCTIQVIINLLPNAVAFEVKPWHI